MAIDPQRDLADRTFKFAGAIVRFCTNLSAQGGVASRIAWQLVDAGTSIAANYEEAIAAYSRRDFMAKTSIILKEARESRLWLRVIAANDLARPEELDALLKESNELVAIFTASMKTLRAKDIANAVVVLIAGVALAWYLF